MADRFFFRNGKLYRPDAISKIEKQARDAASEWHSVTSSNVRAICWTSDHGLMAWFGVKPGAKQSVYWYKTAPRSVFQRMLESRSKGTFLNEEVIPKYPSDGPHPPPT